MHILTRNLTMHLPGNTLRRVLAMLLAMLTASALLGACGFQLRGSSSLPFATLWVGTAESNQLGNLLKRHVRAGSSTRVVNDAQDAEARFELVSESRDKEIISLNSAGRVREYVLRYRVSFRLHDGRGTTFIPVTELILKREISFNESEILANESEEALLYRDMQSDLVQQIIRRMAAVKRT